MFHALLDHACTQALRIGVLYRDGFGDRAQLARIVESVESYSRERPLGTIFLRDVAPAKKLAGGEIRLATFESPGPTPVAAESRIARVQIWSPSRMREMCIILAATGDEGFFVRRGLAQRLFRAGIGSVVLENPYYGSRRPRGQYGPALRSVADQFAMNTATVDEARALLGWIRDAGYVPGVTGFSQGGFMAAFAGTLVDFPTVVVTRAGGTHAVPVMMEGALRRTLHWPSLVRDAGDEASARAELLRCFGVVDLRRHPAPVDPTRATIMVSRHDRIFPAGLGLDLHRHWPGSKLIVSNTGHITAALAGEAAHAQAIVEAFAGPSHREAAAPRFSFGRSTAHPSPA